MKATKLLDHLGRCIWPDNATREPDSGTLQRSIDAL